MSIESCSSAAFFFFFGGGKIQIALNVLVVFFWLKACYPFSHRTGRVKVWPPSSLQGTEPDDIATPLDELCATMVTPSESPPPKPLVPLRHLESWYSEWRWVGRMIWPPYKGTYRIQLHSPPVPKNEMPRVPHFFLGKKDIVFHPWRNGETLMKLWVPGKMIASRGLQLGNEYLNDADFKILWSLPWLSH